MEGGPTVDPEVRDLRMKAPARPQQGGELRAIPVHGIADIKPGDPLAEIVLGAIRASNIQLGPSDILVLKHKIVAKAEGRIVHLAQVKPSRQALATARRNNTDARAVELALHEAKRVLRDKHVLITETQHGFVCANSGVDVSNVDGGKSAVLLPADPDASASKIHRRLKNLTGLHVPVIISDSFGRAWRQGLCDVAIGVAGMRPLRDYRGRRDGYGYTLRATEQAVADELAAMAGLVAGKDARVPACIIRGYVYARGSGGARQLIRPADRDLFR
jgi:coenzyme F420-0:L-glutamate ligase/coenzyme F420-1:gamma-L-glutamate ligase